ncbi:MAG TPA: single-stranded DNA-binding protein [Chitinophagaceae bacterium]|jgi:single-strand DNA-binding protein|nr:single-stranded DNA-binding protein [Chitinophagaceae bacterium]
MIKMQVIGRLGKDCTVNTVNGKNVINFTVAHSEKYKDNQGNLVEKTTWVECAYWTDRTAVATYLTKGTQVYAEGQPEARAYAKNDGGPGASLILRVREVQLLGSKNENGGGSPAYSGNNNAGASSYSNQKTSSVPSPNDITEPMDDLPF